MMTHTLPFGKSLCFYEPWQPCPFWGVLLVGTHMVARIPLELGSRHQHAPKMAIEDGYNRHDPHQHKNEAV